MINPVVLLLHPLGLTLDFLDDRIWFLMTKERNTRLRPDYDFSKDRGGDPIAHMPVARFMSEEMREGWPTDSWVIVAGNEELEETSERMWQELLAGDDIGYFSRMIHGLYGSGNTHEHNVRLGELQDFFRWQIIGRAQELGIDLQAVRLGEVSLEDETLRKLFIQHHEVAVELTVGNLGLVAASLQHVEGISALSNEEIMDLVMEGATLLFKAAKRFDPWKDDASYDKEDPSFAYRFSTYAVSYIVGGMKTAKAAFPTIRLTEHALSTGRIAHRMSEIYKKLYNVEPNATQIATLVALKAQKMRKGDLSDPTVEELAVFTSTPKSSLKKINRARKYVGHIQRSRGLRKFSDKVRTRYQDSTSGEWIEDEMEQEEGVENIPDTLDVEEVVYENRRNKLISEVVGGLTERQAQIIRSRFWEDMTFEETGDTIGISGDRTRQIEHQAIRSIRDPFGVAETLHNYLHGKATVAHRMEEPKDESVSYQVVAGPREEFVWSEIYYDKKYKDESRAVDIDSLFQRVGKQLRITDVDELREILQSLQKKGLARYVGTDKKDGREWWQQIRKPKPKSSGENPSPISTPPDKPAPVIVYGSSVSLPKKENMASPAKQSQQFTVRERLRTWWKKLIKWGE